MYLHSGHFPNAPSKPGTDLFCYGSCEKVKRKIQKYFRTSEQIVIILSALEKSHLFKLEKYFSALTFEPKIPEPYAVFAL